MLCWQEVGTGTSQIWVLPVPHPMGTPRWDGSKVGSQEYQQHSERTKPGGKAFWRLGKSSQAATTCTVPTSPQPGPAPRGNGFGRQLVLIEPLQPPWGERACREGHREEEEGPEELD